MKYTANKKLVLIGIALEVEAASKLEAALKIAAMKTTEVSAQLWPDIFATFFFYPADFDIDMFLEQEAGVMDRLPGLDDDLDDDIELDKGIWDV